MLHRDQPRRKTPHPFSPVYHGNRAYENGNGKCESRPRQCDRACRFDNADEMVPAFTGGGQLLERHEVVVNQCLGVCGAPNVLEALQAFSPPRRMLLETWMGLATGDVCFSNVGTHRKVDFTGVGPTRNPAS
jgi:hypothetical protein